MTEPDSVQFTYLIGTERRTVEVPIGVLANAGYRKDDPDMDATDGAHPAWWRGHDNGAAGMTKLLSKKLLAVQQLAQYHGERVRRLLLDHAKSAGTSGYLAEHLAATAALGLWEQIMAEGRDRARGLPVVEQLHSDRERLAQTAHEHLTLARAAMREHQKQYGAASPYEVCKQLLLAIDVLAEALEAEP